MACRPLLPARPASNPIYFPVLFPPLLLLLVLAGFKLMIATNSQPELLLLRHICCVRPRITCFLWVHEALNHVRRLRVNAFSANGSFFRKKTEHRVRYSLVHTC